MQHRHVRATVVLLAASPYAPAANGGNVCSHATPKHRALRILVLAVCVIALALGCGSSGLPPEGCPTGSTAGPDGQCMQGHPNVDKCAAEPGTIAIDTACVPVGIQGCAAMFIEKDGLCHPSMVKCAAEPGTIPKFDTGCVPVGIQGCAAMFIEEDGLCHPSMAKCAAEPGTIPKFDTGCVPVGIQGCDPTFIEQDGLCHPSVAKCPAGTFAVPQSGCVPIDGPAGCGTGTWGNIQDGPNTVWVDPSVATSGAGSKASPVKTIAEALAIVPVGGRIALGTGSYDEPIHVTKSVTIEGRCPSKVRVQGSITAPGGLVAVWVDFANNVTLRGLEIGGPGAGIVADDTASMQIERVHIRQAHVVGVQAMGPNADVLMSNCLIEDTLPRTSELDYGWGVAATDGARLTITETQVVGNRELGAFIDGAGTEVNAAGLVIEGTRARESDQTDGVGAAVQHGARLTLESSAIVANHSKGVDASDPGAVVVATGTLIAGTLAQESDGAKGWGVSARKGARVDVASSAIVANVDAGLFAAGAGTMVTMSGALVEGTLPRAVTKQGGTGAVFLDGAAATLTSTAIVANRRAAVALEDPGTALTATGSLFEGTLHEESNGHMGHGVVVQGAMATIDSSAVIGNHESGIIADQAGASITATGNLVEGTLPAESDDWGGRGVTVQVGAGATLVANAIFANYDVGILVADTDATVSARGNLVAQTSTHGGKKRSGRGVSIQSVAHLTFDSNAIVGNHDVGVFVAAPATRVTAAGNLIENTLPHEGNGEFGVGIACIDFAAVQLVSSALVNNHVAGVLIAQASVDISQSLVSGVPDGTFSLLAPAMTYKNVGDGLLATLGSTLNVTDTLVRGAVRAGLLFDDSIGSLSRVASTDNQFGLVLQGEMRPGYQDGHNQFTANKKQDIVEDGDVPVPDAPSPVPPSP